MSRDQRQAYEQYQDKENPPKPIFVDNTGGPTGVGDHWARHAKMFGASIILPGEIAPADSVRIVSEGDDRYTIIVNGIRHLPYFSFTMALDAALAASRAHQRKPPGE